MEPECTRKDPGTEAAWDALTARNKGLGVFVRDDADPRPYQLETKDIDLASSDIATLAAWCDAFAAYREHIQHGGSSLLSNGGVIER